MYLTSCKTNILVTKKGNQKKNFRKSKGNRVQNKRENLENRVSLTYVKNFNTMVLRKTLKYFYRNINYNFTVIHEFLYFKYKTIFSTTLFKL